MGTASSSCDGKRTTWATTAEVQLPDRGERWQVGPGAVVVRQRGGEPVTVELPQLVLGGPSFGRLVGQGIGSALVILTVLGWFFLRDRQLGREEAERPAFAETLAAAASTLAAEPFSAPDTLEALLALRVDLQGAGVDNAAPTAELLRARLEALRYGGEEISLDACRDWLLALKAAADGGRR